MKLKLQRPLAILDIEATGLNISKDRIVKIAIIKINPDGTEETLSARVNPEIKIPQEVIEIHGITDEDVKDCPTFKEIAPKITAAINLPIFTRDSSIIRLPEIGLLSDYSNHLYSRWINLIVLTQTTMGYLSFLEIAVR